ncbi:hypothetical protein NQ314_017416 [Rhamnusium bicolor]|uniref:Uncharacterized protein n=1 Tax=Rhamnusium bicolor TaxID=1586634 RepID=A0AAV8WTD0_9CUCU|nr:hypothetical protein NQ314_017416 [Rhamnusium bicolor]
MIEKDHGHIVTIASLAGIFGTYKLVDYCASKYAAVGFDDALRVELDVLGIKGVKTTAICPYFIQQTGLFDNVESKLIPRLKPNDVADRVIDALRREETLVTIPSSMQLAMALRP